METVTEYHPANRSRDYMSVGGQRFYCGDARSVLRRLPSESVQCCVTSPPYWGLCPDGKWRRLPPPRVRWLGDGIQSRVAKLRAFGNAIVPTVAAEFIRSYLDLQTETENEL